MPTLPFWCFLNVWASLHFLWSVVMVLIHLIVCFTSVVRKGVLFRFQFGLIFFCTSCLSKKKRSILPVRKNCKKPSTWWSWSARHNEKASSWCSQGERSFWLSRKEAQTCPLRFRPQVKRGRYGIHYQPSNTDKRYWINASCHVFWKIWYKAHRRRIILIDREWKNFGYILNYLRTGRLILPPDAGELLREELLEEAEFYQIRGIVEELRHCPNLPFKDSTILSTEQKQVFVNKCLKKRLKSGQSDFVLAYRA